MQGTSVPSERIFCTAGDLASAHRACLDPSPYKWTPRTFDNFCSGGSGSPYALLHTHGCSSALRISVFTKQSYRHRSRQIEENNE
ncbi:hypothetical protein DPMN_165242 [Dreissena polymorpha]|uniref:Uncharacterized protein n=1 Tax=Dreissena polymorpha TaxID=45954 RepID=A0A9D4EZA3_DREPO|nr:hypothetical protein DPMN_165242 [Dreissena polymorpha]